MYKDVKMYNVVFSCGSSLIAGWILCLIIDLPHAEMWYMEEAIKREYAQYGPTIGNWEWIDPEGYTEKVKKE